MVRPKVVFGEKDLDLQPRTWWTYTVIFTISTCMIVWLFAKNEGYLSKCLVNRVTLYLGNVSSYTFLIHMVVFRYIEAICNMVFDSEFCFYNVGWIKMILGFIFTLGTTQVWLRIIQKRIEF